MQCVDRSLMNLHVQLRYNIVISSEIPEYIVLNVAGVSSLKILQCPAVKALNLIKYSFILK